jgi:hypothetical protein
MAREFITLPDDSGSELQNLANLLWNDLKRRGYRLKAEPDPLEYPATPTIVGRRSHETHFFIVRQTIASEEVDAWIAYARSCTTDTRVSICGPSSRFSPTEIASLKRQGVGVIIHGADGLQTDNAGDLAFHAQAPNRDALKPKVQELLGEALDRLDKKDWRPAFEDACTVLEDECRSYLLKKLKLGTLKYQPKKGGAAVPSAEDIRRMTLGALKNVFCGMISQNHIESKLCSALTKLNPDRIRRAHFRKGGQQEAALRRRAGTHFWLISNALSILV